jgi:divalent metal cation (Fe/Co/Zn/Cd) transporter
VPGAWTVRDGHAFLERLEADLRAALPRTTIDIHLEPLEEEASFRDQGLDRD